MKDVIFPAEEYLNGFRRYIPYNRGKGRPSQESSEQISYLDYPEPLRELPKIGQKILIFDTIMKNRDLGTDEKLLFDRYEIDCSGHPIVYKVREISNGTLRLEQVIEAYNNTYVRERPIPCAWIMSGHMGWITPQEFYKKLKEDKTSDTL